ncbi:MAG: peptidoglycan DD-metalloendopeptidase family protein [Xanthomonadales bacterium]|nr:peptidoglycan DD-metalloendopeptidase family protein [Xanthomonadales bacterium]
MIRGGLTLMMTLGWVLAACSHVPAPVEERDPRQFTRHLTADGHYAVRPGDTLHAIAFGFGLDWRDLAAWNGIRSPYLIYPEQEIRLSPPKVVTRPAPSRAARTRPLDDRPARESSITAQSEVSESTQKDVAGTQPALTKEPPSSTPVNTPVVPVPDTASSVSRPMVDPTSWLWPTDGRIISTFSANDSMRKGLDIGGREGQPVRATAAGRVVYSGSGLIGFGELIIIKHSESMLSAYAHNRKRLVSEGQEIAAGQLIAEMGRNDRNQQILHFEIRRNGVPEDPLKYLPGR